MQLDLFDNLCVLENEGFKISKTFQPSGKDKFKKLESTLSVALEGNTILYVQGNHDGTFNTFGFNDSALGVSLEEIIEIAKNKNNWCLIIKE